MSMWRGWLNFMTAHATRVSSAEFDAMLPEVVMISGLPDTPITAVEWRSMERALADARAGRPVRHPFPNAVPVITDMRTGERFVRDQDCRR